MRGGLRSRLVLDSARVAIIAALGDLGWFDATVFDDPAGDRRHRPLQYVTKPGHWDREVATNSLAITAEDMSDDDIGLGGELEDTTRCYCDIFAQDDDVGLHLAGDVRDIMLGKYASLGRQGAFVDVYDFRAATPFAFTTVDVDNVRIDRALNDRRIWQQHWFMVRFDLIDDYADEYQGATPATEWTDDLYPAWQRIQALEAMTTP